MHLPEDLAAAATLLGLIMYAAFGGADFGSGIWTALAIGPRAQKQREALFEAIGPIWETHHVWLIFVVVTLFTCFPRAFAVLFTALLIPFVVALVGINFRGAAFAFRHFGQQTRRRLPATLEVFSLSSILTPFALGTAFTAAASGRIHVSALPASAAAPPLQDGLWATWLSLFTLGGGLVGVAICAFLAPIYMTVRTAGDLQEDFRKEGMAAALVLGVLTAAEAGLSWWDAPLFVRQLLRPLPLAAVALAVLGGLATLYTLWARRYRWAQVIAAGTVAAIFAGFGAGLYPYIVLGEMTISEAAAAPATIWTYLAILPFGALILVPSLLLLYRTFTRGTVA